MLGSIREPRCRAVPAESWTATRPVPAFRRCALLALGLALRAEGLRVPQRPVPDPYGLDECEQIMAENYRNMQAADLVTNCTALSGCGEGVFEDFIRKTATVVNRWPVEPARHTDRVAVTIFQPASLLERFVYVIRSVSHRLGPRWGLQVFYGTDAERETLSRALGDPEHVVWTPIQLQGDRISALTKNEANWFRLSVDFWDAVSPEHEHVLIFEADSLLLQGSACLEPYLQHDYVGAPWPRRKAGALGGPDRVEELCETQFLRYTQPQMAEEPEADQRPGGNGGFTLRRRSSNAAAVASPQCQKAIGSVPGAFTRHEDTSMVRLLVLRNASFPSREQGLRFSMETEYRPEPCAVHKPWPYLDGDTVAHVLQTADMS